MNNFNTFLDSNWIQTYRSSDQLWLTDSLNWDNMSSILISDFSFLSFLTNSFFVNTHFLLDSITKFSQLDLILLLSNSSVLSFKTLFISFIFDLNLELTNVYLMELSLFSSNYQDVFSLIIVLSPELIMSFSDYMSLCFGEAKFNYVPVAVFDSYSNNLNYSFITSNSYFILYFLYVWFILYFFILSNTLRWSINFSNHSLRFHYFFNSISKETRIQFEALLHTMVFFMFYWVAVLLTFDDDQEEMIEFIDSLFFIFFVMLTLYFVFRNSVHFFSFLDASVSEGRDNKFIFSQFRADFLNIFSFSMRFYMLIFRVNVYDTVEDFVDTFYIFVGDFDDDEYLSELFFSLHGVIFFTMDNHDDRSFLLEDENDFIYDLYYIYFMLWGKFAYFLFLTLELALKISLGLYISYLIIFEVHSVGCSYSEDKYFLSKREV